MSGPPPNAITRGSGATQGGVDTEGGLAVANHAVQRGVCAGRVVVICAASCCCLVGVVGVGFIVKVLVTLADAPH